MEHPNEEQRLDWDKLLDAMDEHQTPAGMTKAEFSALLAAKELRARLAAEDFSEEDGWQRFSEARNTRHAPMVKSLRWSVAAALLLAAGAAVWTLLPVTRHASVANDTSNDKVRLKLAGGRVVEVGHDSMVIGHGSFAQIGVGNNKLVYTPAQASVAANLMDTLEVPRGLPFQVQLADGTQVWLNAGSTLIYSPNFTDNRREIFLTGEAFFEVAANPHQPFVVHTNGVEMRVLGTGFNVNAYKAAVVTTLCSGKLQVSDGVRETVMLPDEQTTADGSTLQKSTVDTRDFTAWKEGDLYYDNVSFADITESLSRYYPYEFVFGEPALAQLNFTLDMPRPAHLQEVLNQLRASRSDVDFSIKGHVITIVRK